MKFGVNTYIWGSAFGPADFHLLPRLKASGFDGIEVPILNPAAFEVDAVRRELDRVGLARTAVANVPGGSPRRLAVRRDRVAAVCELVAEQVGERLVCELGLLQTDDVRLPLVEDQGRSRGTRCLTELTFQVAIRTREANHENTCGCRLSFAGSNR